MFEVFEPTTARRNDAGEFGEGMRGNNARDIVRQGAGNESQPQVCNVKDGDGAACGHGGEDGAAEAVERALHAAAHDSDRAVRREEGAAAGDAADGDDTASVTAA